MKKERDKICILMATYNGEHFIEEQIKSILSQTYQNFILLIRDDCSTDNTLNIVNDFISSDSRVVLVSNSSKNLGSNKNFGQLLQYAQHTKCKYFCFSDQDDVWNKLKLEIMFDELSLHENINGSNLPILVYSDLEVVDANLKLINKSFMNHQDICHPSHPHRVLVVQNTVTGCATMFNKSLLNICVNLPKNIIVHDWWFAVCAATCGLITYIELPLVKYRQHGNNQIGVSVHRNYLNPLRKDFYKKILSSKASFKKVFNQAEDLLKLKKYFLNKNFERDITIFCNLKKVGFIKRIIYLQKIKFCRSSLLTSIFLWVRIIFM